MTKRDKEKKSKMKVGERDNESTFYKNEKHLNLIEEMVQTAREQHAVWKI